MPYRRPPAFARNDALTPGGYAQLRSNAKELQDALRFEHVEATGEHNTPLVARAVGTAQIVGGPAWQWTGHGDVSVPSVFDRDLYLNLATYQRYEKDGGPLWVQSASNRGPSSPTLSMARWFDDTRVEVTSSYWSGTLGVSGSGFWTATGDDSGHFHLAVHGRQLAAGAYNDLGAGLLGRQGLRADSGSAYVNQLLQAEASLEASLRVAHTVGVHNVREIAKAWAHVQWTGSGFSIVDQVCSAKFDGGQFTQAAQVSTGVVDLTWAAPLATAGYQVFIDVDYSRLVGDAVNDYYVASAPISAMSAGAVRVYLYKRFLDGAGVEYFDRGSAVDFHVWLFDNH